jgi:hypothetical protein
MLSLFYGNLVALTSKKWNRTRRFVARLALTPPNYYIFERSVGRVTPAFNLSTTMAMKSHPFGWRQQTR